MEQSMHLKSRGMTLIELVIVVSIIGLLAAIAVPSYRQYVLRANRAEAKSALLNLAAAQEKFYLQNNTYATNSLISTAAPTGLGLPATTEKGYYTLTIANGANAAGFSATATAAASHAADTRCATFTIDQTGTRSATNTDCW